MAPCDWQPCSICIFCSRLLVHFSDRQAQTIVCFSERIHEVSSAIPSYSLCFSYYIKRKRSSHISFLPELPQFWTSLQTHTIAVFRTRRIGTHGSSSYPIEGVHTYDSTLDKAKNACWPLVTSFRTKQQKHLSVAFIGKCITKTLQLAIFEWAELGRPSGCKVPLLIGFAKR